MADRDWALLAKATSIRSGGKEAFIKFIVAAGSQAGTDTIMVTSRSRLENLCERLRHLQHIEDRIPVVPLLEIRLTDLGDHPKAATYDQFKTGHSEGLRHTH